MLFSWWAATQGAALQIHSFPARELDSFLSVPQMDTHIMHSDNTSYCNRSQRKHLQIK